MLIDEQENLKIKQIEFHANRILKKYNGNDKGNIIEIIIQILKDFLNEEIIKNTLKTVENKDIKWVCNTITNQISSEFLSLTYSDCYNYLKRIIKIEKWLNWQVDLIITFIYNLLPFVRITNFKEENLIIRVPYYNQQPLQIQINNFIKQSLAHELKKVNNTFLNQVKFNSDPDFLTKANGTKYYINKDYITKNIDKRTNLNLIATYLLTDGSLTSDYKIRFASASKFLIYDFMELIRSLSPTAHFNIEKGGKNGSNYFSISHNNQYLAEILWNISPTFRTSSYNNREECVKRHGISISGYKFKRDKKGKVIKDENSQPILLPVYYPPATYRNIIKFISKNPDFLYKVLRIIADTECTATLSVNKNGKLSKKIHIAQTHPRIIKEIEELLNMTGIDPFIVKRHSLITSKSKNSSLNYFYLGLNITTKYIDPFFKYINFSEGVKVGGTATKFKGFNKSTILHLMKMINDLQNNGEIKANHIPNLKEKLIKAAKKYENVMEANNNLSFEERRNKAAKLTIDYFLQFN